MRAGTEENSGPLVVLSFDVGVRNLGYAVLEVCRGRDMRIARSGLYDLNKQRGITMLKDLVRWLYADFGGQPYAVLVECQMRAQMKVVATTIAAHFLTRGGCEVHSISPRCKLSHTGPSAKYLTYAGRKQLAVDEVARLTGGWTPPGPKCDDVCDAVLQAYAHCIGKRLVLPDSSIGAPPPEPSEHDVKQCPDALLG